MLPVTEDEDSLQQQVSFWYYEIGTIELQYGKNTQEDELIKNTLVIAFVGFCRDFLSKLGLDTFKTIMENEEGKSGEASVLVSRTELPSLKMSDTNTNSYIGTVLDYIHSCHSSDNNTNQTIKEKNEF